MGGRKKQLSDDAEKLHFSLTPEEQLVLQVIRVRRKRHNPQRSGQSQIVADGLWKLLLEEEKVPREYITRLSEVGLPDVKAPKVREFRGKESS
jgi:hypothetical protein